jgi:uncharacterized membrane protein YkvI
MFTFLYIKTNYNSYNLLIIITFLPFKLKKRKKKRKEIIMTINLIITCARMLYVCALQHNISIEKKERNKEEL